MNENTCNMMIYVVHIKLILICEFVYTIRVFRQQQQQRKKESTKPIH